MPLTITLTIYSEKDAEILKDANLHTLRYLFCDAFGEFQSPRRDSEEYVLTRYQWMTPSQQLEKIKEVQERVLLAEALRNGAAGGDIKVELT